MLGLLSLNSSSVVELSLRNSGMVEDFYRTWADMPVRRIYAPHIDG